MSTTQSIFAIQASNNADHYTFKPLSTDTADPGPFRKLLSEKEQFSAIYAMNNQQFFKFLRGIDIFEITSITVFVLFQITCATIMLSNASWSQMESVRTALACASIGLCLVFFVSLCVTCGFKYHAVKHIVGQLNDQLSHRRDASKLAWEIVSLRESFRIIGWKGMFSKTRMIVFRQN